MNSGGITQVFEFASSKIRKFVSCLYGLLTLPLISDTTH